jgi:glyoxylase-like metal-dependent hydrolase (beta-lactamase superfamily II)
MPAINIGSYKVSSLETGQFALDGGAMFGVVPKTLWQKTNPADDANRIPMNMRSLLIQKPKDAEGPARNMIVDCGIGYKWTKKMEGIFKIDHSQFSVDRGLKEHDLTPDAITDVIQTHLHFDHAGGLTKYLEGASPGDKNAEVEPVFQNATVWVEKRNWDLAWSPTEKDRASYLQENYSPYKNDPAFSRKLNILETAPIQTKQSLIKSGRGTESTEIAPGISVEVSDGHTIGMMMVKIADSKISILYGADLIPMSSHIRIPYIMAYDCHPMLILEEKKSVLNRMVDENGLLFFEHCPFVEGCSVKRTERGDFEMGEAFKLS